MHSLSTLSLSLLFPDFYPSSPSYSRSTVYVLVTILSLRSILNPVYYSSSSSNSLLQSHDYPLLFPVFFPSIPTYSPSLLSSFLTSLSTIPLVPYIPCILSFPSLLFPVTILPVSFYSLSTIFLVSPIPCTLVFQSLLFPVIILPVSSISRLLFPLPLIFSVY